MLEPNVLFSQHALKPKHRHINALKKTWSSALPRFFSTRRICMQSKSCPGKIFKLTLKISICLTFGLNLQLLQYQQAPRLHTTREQYFLGTTCTENQISTEMPWMQLYFYVQHCILPNSGQWKLPTQNQLLVCSSFHCQFGRIEINDPWAHLLDHIYVTSHHDQSYLEDMWPHASRQT